MVLVDTSIWIDSFRTSNADLAELLRNYQVVTHSMVIGELACGNLKNRAAFMNSLGVLPRLESAEHEPVLEWISNENLFGIGLGWVDLNLLYACRQTQTRLLTADRRLLEVATQLDLK